MRRIYIFLAVAGILLAFFLGTCSRTAPVEKEQLKQLRQDYDNLMKEKQNIEGEIVRLKEDSSFLSQKLAFEQGQTEAAKEEVEKTKQYYRGLRARVAQYDEDSLNLFFENRYPAVEGLSEEQLKPLKPLPLFRGSMIASDLIAGDEADSVLRGMIKVVESLENESRTKDETIANRDTTIVQQNKLITKINEMLTNLNGQVKGEQEKGKKFRNQRNWATLLAVGEFLGFILLLALIP